MADFIHYHKRVVNLRPRKSEPKTSEFEWAHQPQSKGAGFTAPAFHITRSPHGPAARIKVGDTIWHFARLHSSQHSADVALDAKIVVEKVTPRPDGPGFRYQAGQGSCWFALFNPGEIFNNLKTLDDSRNISDLLSRKDQPPGQAMQHIREILDPAPLHDLERRIGDAETHFISYRHKGGLAYAFAKCRELVRDNRAVWWDRWSLPRRLAERREKVSDRALDSRIRQQLLASDVVWGIETKHYDEAGCYALKEKQLAEKYVGYRPVIIQE